VEFSLKKRIVRKAMTREQEIIPLSKRLEYIATQTGIEILDQEEIPESPAVYAPIPLVLDSSVYDSLADKYPKGLYSHQTNAIESVLDGNDVCLATPTASGKSLVFMTVASNLLKRDPAAKALALYPSKALIQDQLNKWKQMLRPLGFEPGYIDVLFIQTQDLECLTGIGS
jgi:DEAD/DEAH box helicase domain-containing protein